MEIPQIKNLKGSKPIPRKGTETIFVLNLDKFNHFLDPSLFPARGLKLDSDWSRHIGALPRIQAYSPQGD